MRGPRSDSSTTATPGLRILGRKHAPHEVQHVRKNEQQQQQVFHRGGFQHVCKALQYEVRAMQRCFTKRVKNARRSLRRSRQRRAHKHLIAKSVWPDPLPRQRHFVRPRERPPPYCARTCPGQRRLGQARAEPAGISLVADGQSAGHRCHPGDDLAAEMLALAHQAHRSLSQYRHRRQDTPPRPRPRRRSSRPSDPHPSGVVACSRS